jgi:aminopeptidase YwaD
MHGRGYAKNGDGKASRFIRDEFTRIGLKPLGNSYFQTFNISVNTYPGAMKLKINNHLLKPGHDFVINPASPKLKGKFDTFRISAKMMTEDSTDSYLMDAKGKVLIVDTCVLQKLNTEDKNIVKEKYRRLLNGNSHGIKAILELTTEKLSFGAARYVMKIPYLMVHASSCCDTITSVEINMINRFLDRHKTANITCYVPGTAYPDSFLVFTAHYDHLGLMGRKTFFPGANDNASGVAMVLSLAKYFQEHPQHFSVAFLMFSGEEAGLIGSGFFADYPLIKLSAIKFLINLDLVGTGIDGITVVNGNVYAENYNRLLKLNEREKFLPSMQKRGEACNSDHCPFYKKNVPCFFIYTLGGTSAYHDLNDRPESLPLSGFEGLMKLLIEFARY